MEGSSFLSFEAECLDGAFAVPLVLLLVLPFVFAVFFGTRLILLAYGVCNKGSCEDVSGLVGHTGWFSATPGVGLLRMVRPEPMKMSKMETSLEDVLDMVAEVACGGCAIQVRKLQSSAIALQKCCGCVTA